MKQIAKRKVTVFGDVNYLLGQDADGINYWLEAPKWDCGWYWGFGYIETYTNNRFPERSRDINSHQHWDSFVVGNQEHYDFEKHAYVKDDYVHHLNDNKKFVATTLTERESWELSDLMKRFYAMKEMAEILEHGTGHLTSDTGHKTFNDEFRAWINEIELPKIFARIVQILDPDLQEDKNG